MANRVKGRRSVLAAGVLIATLGTFGGVTPSLEAQLTQDPPLVSLVGGAFAYDLEREGDGIATFGGIRLSFPLHDYLVLEPGFSFTRFTEDTNPIPELDTRRDIPLLVGELQVQFQYPVDRFRPFVGVGTGGMVDFRDDRETEEEFFFQTYSASAGLRARLSRNWYVLGEARLRGLDQIEVDAVEWTIGIALSY